MWRHWHLSHFQFSPDGKVERSRAKLFGSMKRGDEALDGMRVTVQSDKRSTTVPQIPAEDRPTDAAADDDVGVEFRNVVRQNVATVSQRQWRRRWRRWRRRWRLSNVEHVNASWRRWDGELSGRFVRHWNVVCSNVAAQSEGWQRFAQVSWVPLKLKSWRTMKFVLAYPRTLFEELELRIMFNSSSLLLIAFYNTEIFLIRHFLSAGVSGHQ